METRTQVPKPGPGQQQPREQEALVQLAGIWSQTSKNGTWYGTGSVGNCRYLILPNTNKKKEHEPDYQLCVAKRQPKKNQQPTAPAKNRDEPPPCDENGVIDEELYPQGPRSAEQLGM